MGMIGLSAICDSVPAGEPTGVTADTCPRCGAKVIASGSDLAACENGHVCHRDSPAESPTTDPIDHPPHYTAGEIECIDAIEAALGDGFADYLRGCILKYAWRLPHKNAATEDAKKLAWYTARLVEVLGKK